MDIKKQLTCIIKAQGDCGLTNIFGTELHCSDEGCYMNRECIKICNGSGNYTEAIKKAACKKFIKLYGEGDLVDLLL